VSSPLFHYCDVSVFHAIATYGRVRLSSVRHANDATEGTLLSAAVARLARRAGVVDAQLAKLQQRAQDLEVAFDGMALCLSEDGDLLSQWRGYADDGQGVAIGFSRTFLDELVALSDATDDGGADHFDLALYQARYLEAEHDAAVTPLFGLLRDFENQSVPSDLAKHEQVQELTRRLSAIQNLRLLLEAFDLVYSLKHAAFTEEREWRLLHHLDWRHAKPSGFHPRRGRLVPYVDLQLSAAPSPAIEEVVLGPRHTTPRDVVLRFLEATGHPGAKVRHSSSPYRRDA
jgi:hypothetical protein